LYFTSPAPPNPTLFPYTTLFRSRPSRGLDERRLAVAGATVWAVAVALASAGASGDAAFGRGLLEALIVGVPIATGLYALRAPVKDRKSTRLNSSHVAISYAVFCL